MELSDVLAALHGLTRRRILAMLRMKGLSVAELHRKVNRNPNKPSSLLDLSRPAISQHLRILQEAGLVQCRIQGTRHIYHLDRRGFDKLREHLDGFEGIRREEEEKARLRSSFSTKSRRSLAARRSRRQLPMDTCRRLSGLVVPQALRRIHLRRAPSRNAGGQQRDEEQQQRNGAECQRIAGGHTKQKALHQPGQQ